MGRRRFLGARAGSETTCTELGAALPGSSKGDNLPMEGHLVEWRLTESGWAQVTLDADPCPVQAC